MNPPATLPSDIPAPSADQEVSRAKARRSALGIMRPGAQAEAGAEAPPAPHAQWALALSGGGIRSATFCLGVIQALAKTADPGGSVDAGAGAHQAPANTAANAAANIAANASADGSPLPASAPAPSSAARPWPLLAQFDYLSTVSGGGYIGGFLSSLFVRGRLSGTHHETALETTHRAYEALQEEPPGRIHRETSYDPRRPGATALAWLRDNGRYMAPSGTGDLFYGITIAIRNWFATQYVVASMLLVVLAALQLLRWSLATYCLPYNDLEAHMLNQAQATGGVIWWSPTWLLCGVVLLLAALPLGIAFWFSHPSPNEPGVQKAVVQQAHDKAVASGTPQKPAPEAGLRDHLALPPPYWTRASLFGLLLGLTLLGLAWAVVEWGHRQPLGITLACLGVSAALSVPWYMISAWRTRQSAQGATITLLRVTLTRWLTHTVLVLLTIAALGTIETVAQTAWLTLSYKHGALTSTVLTALVWLLRRSLFKANDESRGGGSDSRHGKLLQSLPVEVISGVVGCLLWLTVAVVLEVLLLKIVWPEGRIDPGVFWDAHLACLAVIYALGALVTFTLMALVVGRFPGFLNLSTLQGLYSARIARAYLGASNHARFSIDAPNEARDVAEPIKGDTLSTDEIHRNPLAPIHYVNVCVNQSVSPGEQLVQRDRKGKPLVVAPGGIYLDNQAFALGQGSGESELSYPLSFGEWLGVSGAAFSTGLGRHTGLGMSLAMGFANVRLGRWWKGLPPMPDMHEGTFAKVFPTQSYLLDELRGLFYGKRRPYLYLSDGGHFENMAVYELLRTDRPRQVRLIVVNDCGCDPDYNFEDLANLTRLVRIDHGLEIKVHPRAHGEALLNQVFARPEDFRRRADGTLPDLEGRCAIMLNVLGTERSADVGVPAGALFARIILIKPVMLARVGVDIAHYQSQNPRFPQETTMDQFFDEAQWESYRQLGLRIGQRVFTCDGMAGYPDQLWRVCMDGLPA